MDNRTSGRTLRHTTWLALFFSLSILGTIFFQLLFFRQAPQFVKIEKIHWQELRGFSEVLDEKLPEYTLLAVHLDSSWSGAEAAVARSATFPLLRPLLQLQFQGSLGNDPAASIIIELYNESNEVVSRKRLFSGDSALLKDYWGDAHVEVDPGYVGKPVSLAIKVRAKNPAEVRTGIRSRVGFLDGTDNPSWFASRRGGRHYLIPFVLAFAIAVFGLILLVSSRIQSPAAILVFYLVLACAIHFRSTVFFYWDEWHLIFRFAEEGVRGGLYSHNEHFVPLCFLFYYLETLLFGDTYWLYIGTSLCIHSLNALLLREIAKRLAPPGRFAGEIATTIGALFLVNSVHVELTQWAFSQATLLYETTVLSGLFIALLSFENPGKTQRYHALIVLTCFAAPLFFGNGLILPLLLAVLGVFAYSGTDKPRVIFRLFSLSALGACLSLLLYLLNTQHMGHGIQSARPFDHPGAVFYYLMLGSQFAGIFRGLGLHSLYPPEKGIVYPRWTQWFDLVNLDSMVLAGILTGLVLGIITYRLHPRGLRYWLFGQLFIVIGLILPAFGRWHLGAQQCFALRYHYHSLIGLCFILLPVFAALRDRWEKQKAAGILACLLGLGYLASHFYSLAQFDYYWRGGLENRTYVSELRVWNKQLQEDPHGGAVIYQGVGTAVEYLEPLNANKVTVGRYPDEVYGALNYLNPERYPLRAPLQKLIELCAGCSSNPKNKKEKY